MTAEERICYLEAHIERIKENDLLHPHFKAEEIRVTKERLEKLYFERKTTKTIQNQ